MREPISLDDLVLPAQLTECGTISGACKEQPEDFRVDELVAFEPSGSGDYRLIQLEKRLMTTDDLVAHVAATLDIDRRDVAVTGLKDKVAVTTQWLSVPAAIGTDRLEALDNDSVKLLDQRLHDERLKRGVSGGNRFDILLRGAESSEVERARAIAKRITASGVPNAYGAQRFGHGGSTFEMGMQILSGDEHRALADVGRHRRSFMKRLALNAVQSGLFNVWLRRRIEDGLWDEVVMGDVLEDHSMGVPIVAMDLKREADRLEKRVVTLTGPMFGIKMRTASGMARTREKAILSWANLGPESFASFRKLMPGARRAARLFPQQLKITPDSEGIRLRFVLPPGAYATEVVRAFQG